VNKLNVDFKDFLCNKHKKVQSEKFARNQLDASRIASVADVQLYKKSDLRSEMIKLMNDLGNGMPFINPYLNRIHGFLFIEICLENASRAGEILNLSHQEFLDRTLNQDGTTSICVKRHKTAHKHGSAILVVRESTMLHLVRYNDHIRPLLAKAGSEKFFLTSKGGQYPSSNVRKSMQQIWSESGAKGEVGPTLLRKAIVTIVHSDTPHLAPKLSRKMNHSNAVAESTYFVAKKTKTCMEVGVELRNIGEETKSSKHCHESPISNLKITVSQPMRTIKDVSQRLSSINSKKTLVQKLAYKTHQKYDKMIKLTPKKKILTKIQPTLVTPKKMKKRLFKEDIQLKTTPDFKKHGHNKFIISEEAVLFQEFYDIIEQETKVPINDEQIVNKLLKIEMDKLSQKEGED